jgi:hypothetical protein
MEPMGEKFRTIAARPDHSAGSPPGTVNSLKILIRGERFAKLRRSSIVKMSACCQGEWAFVRSDAAQH